MSLAAQVVEAEFVIHNKSGLHTRPGAVLVNIAKQFTCEIHIINLNAEGKSASGKSLMKLMTCGIKCGHKIKIVAKGDDAEQALKALGDGIASGLGE